MFLYEVYWRVRGEGGGAVSLHMTSLYFRADFRAKWRLLFIYILPQSERLFFSLTKTMLFSNLKKLTDLLDFRASLLAYDIWI